MAKKKTAHSSSAGFPWSTTRLTPSTAAAVSLFALLVRVLVSLGPYSGQGTPPKYGDYEAQRHWMEITLHTPAAEWYRNTSVNNLSYWGLDYPPLTAYQSLAHAIVLNASVPEAVALTSSRGFESHQSKLMMRWTVLSSDILIFFSAAIYFVWVYFQRNVGGENKDGGGSEPWLLAMILLNPCLILIDHGHFQYNCISLGFTLGAIAAVLSRNELIASALFSLAINHKQVEESNHLLYIALPSNATLIGSFGVIHLAGIFHCNLIPQMSMYYAPIFFSHLLGKCIRRKNPIFEVLKLGVVVLGTFAILWWPYLHSFESSMEVLSRLAPFERGLFEDYVANFWCSTSVFIKWKRIFTMHSMKFLSFIMTVLGLLPSFIQQLKAPSDSGFLYGLLNSSFSFYFFSYQVHEKSILLPLLPASLLALQEPLFFGWLMYYALLSMFPLICRDKLLLQYGSVLALFGLTFFSPEGRSGNGTSIISPLKKLLMALTFSASVALHFVYLSFQPPKRYPFLFDALIMFLCFSQFVVSTLYTNVKQWTLSAGPLSVLKEKDL